jgi:hypothetical protein
MMSKLVRKNILIGMFIIVSLIATTWLLIQDDFVQAMLGITPEAYVINSVKVGDSEQHLVGLLQDHGVDYSQSQEGGRTLYSLGDGFVGVCFFYVTNSTVVEIVFD